MATEETFVPFAHGGRTTTRSVRSTWIGASVNTLRRAGLFDAYLQQLPPESHETILTSIAGTWLPISVGLQHYAACDRLGLSTSRVLEIGQLVSMAAQGTMLDFVLRLAKGAGVTPWTIFAQYPRTWSRIFEGGDLAIVKVGPKEARIEFVGCLCARSHYFRVGIRGVVTNMNARFCTKGYVSEITRLCNDTTIVLRYAWA